MIIWFGLAILWFVLMGSMYGAEGIWFPALFMGYGIAIEWLGSDAIGKIVAGSVIVFWAGYVAFVLGRWIWRKLHRPLPQLITKGRTAAAGQR